MEEVDVKQTCHGMWMSEASEPRLVSVIIPTYNRAELIIETLYSVFIQTYRPIEVIVVDDGSSDNTEKVITELMENHKENRFVYVKHHCNKGIVEARNTGIKKSSGKFIAMIADDYMLPRDYLKKTEEFFQRFNDAGIMSCRMVNSRNTFISRLNQVYCESNVANFFNLPYVKHKLILRRIIYKKEVIKSLNAPLAGAAVIKKELFEKFGLFNTKLRIGEDSEFGWRLARQNIPIFLNPNIKIVHKYRETLFQTLIQKFNYGKGLNILIKICPLERASLLMKKLESARALFRIILLGPIIPIRNTFIRCSYSSNYKEFILFLPFMLLFTITYLLGVIYGTLNEKFEGILR